MHVTTVNEEPALFRFSTHLLPERDRLTGLREILGKMSRLEFEPLTSSFHADITLRAVGSVGLASIDHSLMRVSRTRELLADGEDALVFSIPSGGGFASQCGREVTLQPGDAVLGSNADVGDFTCSSHDGKSLLIRLSRRELLPRVADFDAALMAHVRKDAASLQLLRRYVDIFADMPRMSQELQQAAIGHIYDLAAMALGPTRDAAEIARGRGVRAARLHAAKAFILHNLSRTDLMASAVAAHLGVTPRYVHMLFQDEAESFSEFLLRERLMRAHRVLVDQRLAGRPISAIAFDAGFSDLSYFNRTFRRRFGMTPSEAREEKLRRP
jgi:AraC-like DNA-binding protein